MVATEVRLMMASELITKLQAIIEKEGDLPVYHWNDWIDFPVDSLEIEDDPFGGNDPDGAPKRIVLHGGYGSVETSRRFMQERKESRS